MGDRRATQRGFGGGDIMEEDHLGAPGVDGRKILKMNLRGVGRGDME
jgi:hypothetical protein